MDKRNIESTVGLQERIKVLFKRFAFDELYDTWVDTFEINVENENEVVVYYHGTDDFKVFRNKKTIPKLFKCLGMVFIAD